jgi:CubicO group peptidase (beta-lactamase class C family)
MVFSCTKVLESLAVAMLVDQGKLSFDDPIAR